MLKFLVFFGITEGLQCNQESIEVQNTGLSELNGHYEQVPEYPRIYTQPGNTEKFKPYLKRSDMFGIIGWILCRSVLDITYRMQEF